MARGRKQLNKRRARRLAEMVADVGLPLYRGASTSGTLSASIPSRYEERGQERVG